MSSRRARPRQSGSSRISDDRVAELVSKLQHRITQRRRRSFDKVAAFKILEETCNYIENLHRDVDVLSDRLLGLLASTDHTTSETAISRSLLY